MFLLWWVCFIMWLIMVLCISAKLSLICNACQFNYVRENVRVCLMLVFSFHYLGFLIFGQLCHMCVMCWVYGVRILNFIRLSLWPGYALYIGLWNYFMFVRYAWVDIYYILIDILGLNCVYCVSIDFMCSFIVLVVLNAIFVYS